MHHSSGRYRGLMTTVEALHQSWATFQRDAARFAARGTNEPFRPAVLYKKSRATCFIRKFSLKLWKRVPPRHRLVAPTDQHARLAL